MDDALGYPLMIEAGDFFPQMKIFQQGWALGTDAQGIVGMGNTHALVGEHGCIVMLDGGGDDRVLGGLRPTCLSVLLAFLTMGILWAAGWLTMGCKLGCMRQTQPARTWFNAMGPSPGTYAARHFGSAR